MQLTQTSPTTYKMTLHSYELATLISAVRWISEGANGSLDPEAIEQMEKILQSYEKALTHLNEG